MASYMEIPKVGSYDDYYKKNLAEAQKQIEEQAAQYKQEQDAQFGTYSELIDQQADAQKKIHEESITAAEDSARQQYDENHINELIARKNVENAMADMGLTNSGLNRSQQTRIAVMRGNADASTRGLTAKRVQSLQDAIAQVYAAAEQSKTAKRLELDSSFDSWKREATSAAQQSASKTAVEMVKADQEAAKAAYEYNEKIVAQLQKNIESYRKERTGYRDSLIAGGMSDDDAWATAYARYPLVEGEGNYSEETNNYYSLYTQALKSGYSSREADTFASEYLGASDEEIEAYRQKLLSEEMKKRGPGLDGIQKINKMSTAELRQSYAYDEIIDSADKAAKVLIKNINGNVASFSTAFGAPSGNDADAIAKRVREKLVSNQSFQNADKTTQQMAVNRLVADIVETTWGRENSQKNNTRMQKACELLSDVGGDYSLAFDFYGNDEPKQIYFPTAPKGVGGS